MESTIIVKELGEYKIQDKLEIYKVQYALLKDTFGMDFALFLKIVSEPMGERFIDRLEIILNNIELLDIIRNSIIKRNTVTEN